jgi:hypothetical protein
MGKRSGDGKDWSRPAMPGYELPGAFKGHPTRVPAPAFALKTGERRINNLAIRNQGGRILLIIDNWPLTTALKRHDSHFFLHLNRIHHGYRIPRTAIQKTSVRTLADTFLTTNA